MKYFAVLLAFSFSFVWTLAGPSGVRAGVLSCELAHSCPAPKGEYTCGDLGECSQCPDNDYCRGGLPATKENQPKDKFVNKNKIINESQACLKFKNKKRDIVPDRLLMFCKTELEEGECKTCLKQE